MPRPQSIYSHKGETGSTKSDQSRATNEWGEADLSAGYGQSRQSSKADSWRQAKTGWLRAEAKWAQNAPASADDEKRKGNAQDHPLTRPAFRAQRPTGRSANNITS